MNETTEELADSIQSAAVGPLEHIDISDFSPLLFDFMLDSSNELSICQQLPPQERSTYLVRYTLEDRQLKGILP